MRAHVIVNPGAAQFRSDPGLVQALGEACRGRAAWTTTATIEQLEATCREVAGARTDLVVLCGGDGSYMAGLSALARAHDGRALPAICLAPGGSSSTVARNWGRLLGDPVRHVCAVLDRAESGADGAVVRPTLLVDDGSGSTRVGFIFGTGLVSRFFDAFYAAGGGGSREASRLVARVAVGALTGGSLARKILQPLPCRLSVDGTDHPAHAFTLIVASVVRNLGLHLLVTHRAGEDPDRPHLVASTLGVRACGMQYHRVLAGRPLLGPGTVDTLARQFRVRFPGAGGRYVLDGDLLACESVRVSAGPRVRIVALDG